MDAAVFVVVVVIQLVLHPMDAAVASVAVDFPLILHLIDATVFVVSVVFILFYIHFIWMLLYCRYT